MYSETLLKCQKISHFDSQTRENQESLEKSQKLSSPSSVLNIDKFLILDEKTADTAHSQETFTTSRTSSPSASQFDPIKEWLVLDKTTTKTDQLIESLKSTEQQMIASLISCEQSIKITAEDIKNMSNLLKLNINPSNVESTIEKIVVRIYEINQFFLQQSKQNQTTACTQDRDRDTSALGLSARFYRFQLSLEDLKYSTTKHQYEIQKYTNIISFIRAIEQKNKQAITQQHSQIEATLKEFYAATLSLKQEKETSIKNIQQATTKLTTSIPQEK